MNWTFVLVCLIAGAWISVLAISEGDVFSGFVGVVVFIVGIIGLIDLCSAEDPFDVEMREDEE